MSQIIIIDSAKAFAEKIEQTYLHHGSMKIKQAVLACLHPIEVPSNVKELVNIIRLDSPVDNGEFIGHRWEILLGEAAALVTAHSRMVPRAMLEELFDNGYQAGEEFGAYDDIDPVRKDFDAIAAKYGYRAE